MRDHVSEALRGLVTHTVALRIQRGDHTATLVQRVLSVLLTQHGKQTLVFQQVSSQDATAVLALLAGSVLSPVERIGHAFFA